MDQPVKTFTSDRADARRWTGRILMAVILGEAIWNLIASVMNNLMVPWLATAMDQSAGSRTSFSHRSYNYPDLFVSVMEFCIAGIVALTLNYFFQRPRAAERVKQVKSSASIVPADHPPLMRTPATATGTVQEAPSVNTPLSPPKMDPFATSATAAVSGSSSPTTTKTLDSRQSAPILRNEPPKPKKPKEIYYNSVGEPLPSDED